MGMGRGGYRVKAKKVPVRAADGDEKSAYSDADLLRMLDRVERDGATMADVGAGFGVSRSAIAGQLKRLRDDLAASESAAFPAGHGPAQRPENRDGGMPAHWYRAGLAARRGAEVADRRAA